MQPQARSAAANVSHPPYYCNWDSLFTQMETQWLTWNPLSQQEMTVELKILKF